MKFLTISILLGLSLMSYSHANTLSDADTEKALKWLETYKDGIFKSKNSKIATARTRLTSAAMNESEAFNLYLACVDQENFAGKGLPTKDFLEWKNNEKAKFNKPGFKRGLRVMCQWLLVRLKMAEAEYKEEDLDPSPEISQIINEIQDQLPIYMEAPEGLEGGIGEMIANALKISDIKPKNWCTTPREVGRVFDAIILPMMKQKPETSIKAYRDTWLTRIGYENNIIIKPRIDRENRDKSAGGNRDSGNGDDKDKNKGRRSGIAGGKGTNLSDQKNDINLRDRKAKFNAADTALSDLYWRMELDCFDFGDQKTALQNMMKTLSELKDIELIEARTNSLEELLKNEFERSKMREMKKKAAAEAKAADDEANAKPFTGEE